MGHNQQFFFLNDPKKSKTLVTVHFGVQKPKSGGISKINCATVQSHLFTNSGILLLLNRLLF